MDREADEKIPAHNGADYEAAVFQRYGAAAQEVYAKAAVKPVVAVK